MQLRISGPLLDRIDFHIEVSAVSYQELRSKDGGASSSEMRGA
jgi:predicted ATPase with chaperone activity